MALHRLRRRFPQHFRPQHIATEEFVLESSRFQGQLPFFNYFVLKIPRFQGQLSVWNHGRELPVGAAADVVRVIVNDQPFADESTAVRIAQELDRVLRGVLRQQ